MGRYGKYSYYSPLRQVPEYSWLAIFGKLMNDDICNDIDFAEKIQKDYSHRDNVLLCLNYLNAKAIPML